jgi:hypothetical protein
MVGPCSLFAESAARGGHSRCHRNPLPSFSLPCHLEGDNVRLARPYIADLESVNHRCRFGLSCGSLFAQGKRPICYLPTNTGADDRITFSNEIRNQSLMTGSFFLNLFASNECSASLAGKRLGNCSAMICYQVKSYNIPIISFES